MLDFVRRLSLRNKGSFKINCILKRVYTDCHGTQNGMQLSLSSLQIFRIVDIKKPKTSTQSRWRCTTVSEWHIGGTILKQLWIDCFLECCFSRPFWRRKTHSGAGKTFVFYAIVKHVALHSCYFSSSLVPSLHNMLSY